MPKMIAKFWDGIGDKIEKARIEDDNLNHLMFEKFKDAIQLLYIQACKEKRGKK